MKIGVIGSGPAAMAATYELVRSGNEVTVLDVGNKIEDDLRALTTAGSSIPAEEIVETIRKNRAALAGDKSSLPEKLPFGSRFVYKQSNLSHVQLDKQSKLVTSLALGGLSNVWGANANAVALRDIENWPVEFEELTSCYESLNEFMDVSSETDVIDELYTTRIGQHPTYSLGPQGKNILEHTRKNTNELKQRGLYVGRAKIACGKRHSVNGLGCVSCGLCMHGCPYNAIFNSANVLNELVASSKIHYLPGFEALTYTETGSEIRVHCRNIQDATTSEFAFDRLVVACGVIGSTAIVARSLNWCDHEFTILDSQKYYFPFLTSWRTPETLTVKQNTLAQVFVQMPQLISTKHIVHSQLYPYNDMVLESLRHSVGKLADLGARMGGVFERLMIGMVYLHSDDSGTLHYKVNSIPNEGLGSIRGTKNPQSRKVASEYFGLLTKNARLMGGRPFPIFAKEGPPGRSQHFGGSLPMRKTPGPYETDSLGRPHGCTRVHVVDSSVFPSVPGTPTTYTVMANATRIARKLLNN